MNTFHAMSLAGALVCATLLGAAVDQKTQAKEAKTMQLGNFSVSLAVKDIQASKAFYEKLDFKQVAGQLEQNWVILQNGSTTIGLFQGMFERNTMTFNPGWTKDMQTPKDFQDVRELQKILKERGIKAEPEVDESKSGPGSFMIKDPDGNPILFDQHVPSPKR